MDAGVGCSYVMRAHSTVCLYSNKPKSIASMGRPALLMRKIDAGLALEKFERKVLAHGYKYAGVMKSLLALYRDSDTFTTSHRQLKTKEERREYMGLCLTVRTIKELCKANRETLESMIKKRRRVRTHIKLVERALRHRQDTRQPDTEGGNR